MDSCFNTRVSDFVNGDFDDTYTCSGWKLGKEEELVELPASLITHNFNIAPIDGHTDVNLYVMVDNSLPSGATLERSEAKKVAWLINLSRHGILPRFHIQLDNGQTVFVTSRWRGAVRIGIDDRFRGCVLTKLQAAACAKELMKYAA